MVPSLKCKILVNTYRVHISDINIYLVSAMAKTQVTPTYASPGWQKPIVYIRENAFDGLCHGLPTNYSSVVKAMRIPLEKVSA